MSSLQEIAEDTEQTERRTERQTGDPHARTSARTRHSSILIASCSCPDCGPTTDVRREAPLKPLLPGGRHPAAAALSDPPPSHTHTHSPLNAPKCFAKLSRRLFRAARRHPGGAARDDEQENLVCISLVLSHGAAGAPLKCSLCCFQSIGMFCAVFFCLWVFFFGQRPLLCSTPEKL